MANIQNKFNQKSSKDNGSKEPTDDIAINSSFIERTGFNDGNLTIYFKSGHEITYQDVDESMWEAFKASSSKGSFFSTKIKGKYESSSIKKVPLSTDFTKPRENQWTKLLKNQPKPRKK